MEQYQPDLNQKYINLISKYEKLIVEHEKTEKPNGFIETRISRLWDLIGLYSTSFPNLRLSVPVQPSYYISPEDKPIEKFQEGSIRERLKNYFKREHESSENDLNYNQDLDYLTGDSLGFHLLPLDIEKEFPELDVNL